MIIKSTVFTVSKILYSIGLIFFLGIMIDEIIFNQLLILLSVVTLGITLTNFNLLFGTQILFKENSSIKSYYKVILFRLILTILYVFILFILNFDNLIYIFLLVSSKMLTDIINGMYRNNMNFLPGASLLFSQFMIIIFFIGVLKISIIEFENILLLILLAEYLPLIIFYVIEYNSKNKDKITFSLYDLIKIGFNIYPFTLISSIIINVYIVVLERNLNNALAVEVALCSKFALPIFLVGGVFLNFLIQKFKNSTDKDKFFKKSLLQIFGSQLAFVILILIFINYFNKISIPGINIEVFQNLNLNLILLIGSCYIFLSLSSFVNQCYMYLNLNKIIFFKFWFSIISIISIISILNLNYINYFLCCLFILFFAFLFISNRIRFR